MSTPENDDLTGMRVEYVEKDGAGDLDVAWLGEDPATGWLTLLRSWLRDAHRSGVSEPNAMVVATVDAQGRPVTRSVLCKHVDDTGITFFTNYDSAKGEQLALNPYASATFPWYQLGRQVHIRGAVTKVSAQETADYWAMRPRGSQLGAWASQQSRPIASRAALMAQLSEVTDRFADLDATALGRVSDRAGDGRVLAGPGEQGAQPGPCAGFRRRASAAVRKLFADTTPLRTPDFRRLWLAGIVTVIGANLTIFAVPVQLYALTQSSFYVGLSGLFGLVPLVVFGLYGGAWADAMDRRLLLVITSIGLAVASALLWLQAVLELNNVWVVLCLLSVQQAFFAVNSPTRSAAIPRMLPIEQLPAANSLNITVFQFGAIIGPLLAGVMLRWVDLSTLYLIDTLCCVAPIAATIRIAAMPATSIERGSARWGFAAVLDGFRYLAGNRVVLMSFVVDLIAMIFGMPRALFPQMAHESFGGPVEGGTVMAFLAAAMSVGAVAGGVFSGWLPRIQRQGLAVVVAIVVWGVAMIGFGVAGGMAHGHAGTLMWIALVFLAIGGAADMVSSAFRSTILQEAASDDLRGRLQGVFTVVVAGGPRIADTLHGAAAAAVGTTVAAAGGGLLVVIGVIFAALVVPAFVRYRVGEMMLRSRDPEPDKV